MVIFTYMSEGVPRRASISPNEEDPYFIVHSETEEAEEVNGTNVESAQKLSEKIETIITDAEKKSAGTLELQALRSIQEETQEKIAALREAQSELPNDMAIRQMLAKLEKSKEVLENVGKPLQIKLSLENLRDAT